MLDRRRTWTPSDSLLHRTFLAALVANVAIVVTGGAVRLTASGLGCPTFPRCTSTSLVTTREMGVHGVIEFGNRMLTFALSAVVAAAIVVAWRARRRDLLRPAGLLFLGIVVQAAIGGVTVLTGLNPVTVMVHFLVSMGLVAVATVALERAGGPGRATTPDACGRAYDEAGRSYGTGGAYERVVVVGVRLLTAAVASVLVLGTVVTGTGPHAGDLNVDNRLPFELAAVSQLHADVVFLVVGLAIGLLVAARAAGAGPMERRLGVLLVVVLAQGLIGAVQYATELPEALVAAHLLGAGLVWVATVRVLLAVGGGRQPSEPCSSSSEISNRGPLSSQVAVTDNELPDPGSEKRTVASSRRPPSTESMTQPTAGEALTSTARLVQDPDT